MQRYRKLTAQPGQEVVRSDSALAIVDAFLEWTSKHRVCRTCERFRDRTQWFVETIHQDYYRNNPQQGYCRVVVGPKLEKFRKVFKDKLKAGD